MIGRRILRLPFFNRVRATIKEEEQSYVGWFDRLMVFLLMRVVKTFDDEWVSDSL